MSLLHCIVLYCIVLYRPPPAGASAAAKRPSATRCSWSRPGCCHDLHGQYNVM